MVNRGEMIVYMTKAGFPVEVARLIDWFRVRIQTVSQIMRGLPPLTIIGKYVDQTITFWEETLSMRGKLETQRYHPARNMMPDHLEFRPSWGYLQ